MYFLTAGESHGEQLTAIIEGLPAGISLTTAAINEQLMRRQQGYGRGARMKIETDKVVITAGLRKGLTLGSPLVLTVANNDWKNWRDVMNYENDGDIILSQKKEVVSPRPGHADLVGGIKYNHRDLRNVLERSSARETTMRVAVGAVAKVLLEQLNINIYSYVKSIGSVTSKTVPNVGNMEIVTKIENSPVRVADGISEREMIAAIDNAKAKGDTLGGIVEVVVHGLPAGIGSYVHYNRKLDGIIAKGLMSIQAVKGVEFGLGFEASRLPGSLVHDEIIYSKTNKWQRSSNNLGGLEGGMTTGEPLIVSIAMKPISTLMKPLNSVNINTKDNVQALIERADVCAVPALAVIAENVIAWEIANVLVTEHYSDTLIDLKTSLNNLRQKGNNF